jgi:tyrosine-protein kinase Etk/Wzc
MQLRAKITSLTDLVRQQRSYALEGLRVKYQTAVDIENSLLKDLQAKRAEDRKLSGELAQYNQIKREYQNLVDLHQSVLRQLKLTQLSASSKTVTAAIREFATIATSSAYPRVPGIILLATGVGLFLGVAAAIFRQALDQDLCLTQLRDEQQVLKVLGMIPITALSTAKNPLTSKRNLKELLRIPQATQSAPLSDSSSIACSDPHNPSSDAFRSLRTAILASPEFAHPRSLLITSAGQGEGKTYISENLAISMAQSERRTLLIDADLRKTTSFSSLGLDDHSPGLCDYLLGNAPLDSIIFQSTVPNLYILPAGKPLNQPSELIHSPLMKELLKKLTGAYEYVLIDSPPTAIFSDSISLGSCADAVLFVTREGMSQTPALTEAILRLKSARAHVLGFVINHVTPLYAAA